MLNNVYNKKDFWVIFTIYIVVLAKSLYASRLGFGLLDEGEYLHIGLRILRGDIPYRDFFSYLPPLYDYWNAFAFKLFGISAYSPRLLNSIIFSFVPVLYYLIARHFSSRIVTLLIALSFGFIEMSIERLYYHIFTFSSLFCYFTFLRNNKKEIGLLSGLLLGITALFRVDIALQFLLGLTIANILYHVNVSSQVNSFRKWFYTPVKQLAMVGSGFLIPVIGFLYWLTSHDVLSQFVRSAIGTPSAFFKAQVLPFPKPWNIFPQALSPKEMFASYEAFFAYLIILIYAYALYHIVRNWKGIWRNVPELPTFLLIAVFTTPYIFSRPDLGHMIKGGIPAFFIGAFLLEKCKTSIKNLLLVIPTILLIVGLAQIFWATRFFDTTIQTLNGNIRTTSGAVAGTTFVSAHTIEKSLKFINNNTSPEDQILAVPYIAGLYFLSNRPSKSYVGNIYDSYISNEQKFIEELKLLDIKVVIYDPINTPPGFKKRMSSYYPQIHNFILDNFKVIEEAPEDWLFLVRR